MAKAAPAELEVVAPSISRRGARGGDGGGEWFPLDAGDLVAMDAPTWDRGGAKPIVHRTGKRYSVHPSSAQRGTILKAAVSGSCVM